MSRHTTDPGLEATPAPRPAEATSAPDPRAGGQPSPPDRRPGGEGAQTRAALAGGVQARRGSGEAARRARKAHPLIRQLTLIRYQAHLSGRQVAETGGFFPGLICQWEAGNRHPNLESITTWANALGYDVVLRKRGPR